MYYCHGDSCERIAKTLNQPYKELIEMKITRLTLCLFIMLSHLFTSSQNFESALTEQWENGAWENLFLTTNSLDQNGNITYQLTQGWAIQSSSWVNATRVNYTNNDSGSPSVIVYEQWQNGSWQNSAKIVYSYDTNNNVTNYLYQLWISDSWIDFLQGIYTYNSNGVLEEVLGQYFE